MKAIRNGLLYYKGKFHTNKVLVFDKLICHVLEEQEFIEDQYDNLSIIDAKKNYVLPGFIDVHIHGYKGVDVMDGSNEGLMTLKKSVVENGVTSFLATTMTMSKEKIIHALTQIRRCMEEQEGKGEQNEGCLDGATLLGAHLEGPFINSRYKGAQLDTYIVPPDIEMVAEFKDIIKVVTLAPEIEGAKAMIKEFKEDMVFSIGHSGATYEIAKEAIECGACGTTHLFNAMTGLHHREPGVVGAALTTDCYSELIADLFHVHPSLFSFLIKAKGLDRLLLVTDCIRGGGLDEGNYDLGGQKVTLKEGKCLLPDGTIAGSVLKLNEALRNFNEHVEEALEEVIPLVSLNQAQYLGISEKTGSIDLGKWADIVLMDQNFNVNKTIVKGKIVYEN